MPRKQNGQYAKKRWIKYAMLVALIIGGVAIYADHWNGTQLEAVNPIAPMTVHADITMDGKVDALKEKILDEMVACENPSHLLVWPDDNSSGSLPRKDKVSIGDLAFKLSTVQRFYKTLNGKDLTDKEAMQLALDPSQARELALKAWIGIKGSVNEWSCVSQEMKTQIEDIRFLTS